MTNSIAVRDMESIRSGLPGELAGMLDEFAASTVYEAAGQRGSMDPAIRSVASGMRIAGPALTVRCQPADNLTLHAAVASARPGDVIVADVGDFVGAGHWGEILTVAAQARQISGIVINGGVRDVEAAQRRAFPIFARGICMRATVKEVLGSINQPIICGGVAVHPGDLIIADDDGIVVIPAERIDATLEAAIARETAEANIMDRLQGGELTLDVLGFRRALDRQSLDAETR